MHTKLLAAARSVSVAIISPKCVCGREGGHAFLISTARLRRLRTFRFSALCHTAPVLSRRPWNNVSSLFMMDDIRNGHYGHGPGTFSGAVAINGFGRITKCVTIVDVCSLNAMPCFVLLNDWFRKAQPLVAKEVQQMLQLLRTYQGTFAPGPTVWGAFVP